MATPPHSDPADKVALVSGDTANAGALAGLHARLMLFPPYRLTGDVLKRLGFSGRSAVIAIPYVWLLAFFLTPFLIVLKISFAETVVAIPPYTALITFAENGWIAFHATLDNYTFLFDDPLYINSYLSSLKIASIATLITLSVGYPIAYGMVRSPRRWRFALLMLVILPFWTSFLIRVYAWIGILKKEGLLNLALINLGVISEPLTILNTDTAVYIGIVYSYLPFMVLPLYANLEKMDLNLLEAAADLGCRPIKAFWVITIPLSLSGIIAGCFLVFIPAVGEFVIPDLLGGSETLMIGKTLWSEFFYNRDWPLSSAVAVLLLLVLGIPIVLFQRIQERNARAEA
ncbi:MAG: ABC transporter permease subunit [Kiloniellaceae bacterium]